MQQLCTWRRCFAVLNWCSIFCLCSASQRLWGQTAAASPMSLMPCCLSLAGEPSRYALSSICESVCYACHTLSAAAQMVLAELHCTSPYRLLLQLASMPVQLAQQWCRCSCYQNYPEPAQQQSCMRDHNMLNFIMPAAEVQQGG